MMGTTHAPLGAISGLLSLHLLQAVGVNPPPGGSLAVICAAAVGLVGGLLPDIDQPTSLIANPGQQARKAVYTTFGIRRHSLVGYALSLPFALINLPVRSVAGLLKATLGHRGIMHSFGAGLLWSLTLLAVLAGLTLLHLPALGLWELAVYLLAGYTSHLLSDGITYSGQPLLWPLSKHKFNLAPPGLRVSASGPFNSVLGFAALAVLLALLVLPGGLSGDLLQQAASHKPRQ